MTAKNLARYRNNPNMAFWRNLKQGSDHFEVTKQEPKVSVCNRTYVFDATPAPGRAFDAAQACPPYQVAPQIASAVAAKQRADDAQFAALSTSAPVAPVKTGADGGMHPIFLAKLKERETGQLSYSPGARPAAGIREPAQGDRRQAPGRRASARRRRRRRPGQHGLGGGSGRSRQFGRQDPASGHSSGQGPSPPRRHRHQRRAVT